jgi:ABC-type uncharacterized transport system ATPase subunit
VAGAELIKAGRYGAKLRFDTRATPAEALIASLAAAGGLVDITISDPSLEEVIRTIYEEQAPIANGAKDVRASVAEVVP